MEPGRTRSLASRGRGCRRDRDVAAARASAVGLSGLTMTRVLAAGAVSRRCSSRVHLSSMCSPPGDRFAKAAKPSRPRACWAAKG